MVKSHPQMINGVCKGHVLLPAIVKGGLQISVLKNWIVVYPSLPSPSLLSYKYNIYGMVLWLSGGLFTVRIQDKTLRCPVWTMVTSFQEYSMLKAKVNYKSTFTFNNYNISVSVSVSSHWHHFLSFQDLLHRRKKRWTWINWTIINKENISLDDMCRASV